MSKLISSVASIAVSSCLIFGSDSAQQFAYYVMITMTVLAWLALLSGVVTREMAREELAYIWLHIPLSAYSIYALVTSGHPALAASSLIFALVYWAKAYSPKSGAA